MDGVCDELINLRRYKGRLEPVGSKTRAYQIPSVPGYAIYDQAWVHEMDEDTKWIGEHSLTDPAGTFLRLIDVSLSSATIIKEYPLQTKPLGVEFIKMFMIVVHDDGMDRFMWKDDEYILLTLSSRPEFSLYKSEEAVVQSDISELSGTNDEKAIVLRGEYFQLINEKSNDGFFSGTMFVRAAVKLFDGSYVLHTIPRVISVNNHEIGIYYDKGSAPDNLWVTFTAAKLNVIIPVELYADLIAVHDVVQSVVLFASKVEPVVKWDETIDDTVSDILSSMPFGPSTAYLNSEISTVNPAFKTLHDSDSWYKISEYPLSKIAEGDINEEIDLTGYYQDYATRETLPVDQFSHHEISGNVTHNYNSRLNIGDVKTLFGDYKQFPLEPILDGTEYPNIAPTGYTSFGTRYIRLLTTIETDSGTLLKLGQQTVRDVYNNPSAPIGSIFIALAAGELGYPDTRATKIEILASDDALAWFKVGSYGLSKSKYDNFAYYILNNFSTAATAHITGSANYPVIMHLFSGYTAVDLDSYPETAFHDGNRVQISEVNNPFFFPAENSYQVGTGTVTDFGTNTEPLSVSQFGQHPLIVALNKGMWAGIQGDNGVLYSNFVPINGESAIPGSMLSIGNGVIYATKMGLFVFNGSDKAVDLSIPLAGAVNSDFQANLNYQYYITESKLVNLINSLSTVPALEYIENARLGFDKVNNELVVTNVSYLYSYVYNFDAQQWHKISESYKLLVNYYPKLYAFRYLSTQEGIFDLSTEVRTGTKAVLMTTQPLKLGSESFKVVRRIILRTIHETNPGFFAGFYLFGSSDLINWQRLTGRNHISGRKRDILLQRSGSKFKYFILVFAGQLTSDSYLDSIDISWDLKANKKLR